MKSDFCYVAYFIFWFVQEGEVECCTRRDQRLFSKEKYEEIEIEECVIKVVGEIDLDDDEMKVLCMHPKFAIVECIDETENKFEQEMGYAKVRYELNKEYEEKVDGEEEVEMTREEEEKIEEIEAMSRQYFDPETKTYDYRKKWATDLAENSRVTLPKALENHEEAGIEMRRSAHSKVINQFRDNFCDKKGKQETNLSEVEETGLKRLIKRVKNE